MEQQTKAPQQYDRPSLGRTEQGIWLSSEMPASLIWQLWQTPSFCATRAVKGSETESCSVVSDSATPWAKQSMEFARILEWVAFPFSRGSSQPRDQTQVSLIAGRFFTNWAIREHNIVSQMSSGWKKKTKKTKKTVMLRAKINHFYGFLLTKELFPESEKECQWVKLSEYKTLRGGKVRRH